MKSLLVLLLLSLAAAEDYYDILGIGKDADNRQIRKVSIKSHEYYFTCSNRTINVSAGV